MIENLTDKNITSYMIMSYENSQCVDMEEFEDDMKRVKYIKRLINRYLSGGELKFIPIRKGLLSVYDMQSKGYRFINLETLISFKLGGKTYEIQN